MSILFATPAYGNMVSSAYLSSCILLVQQLSQTGMAWDFLIPERNDSLIQRARNACVRMFLDTDFERLMFIDADIQFSADDVADVWNLDADIGGGIYAMKKPGADWHAAWKDGELVRDLDAFDGPIEVDYLGTGFLMIKRRVFEAFREAFPELTHEESGFKDNFAWFNPRVLDTGDGPWLASEDYAFCHDARGLGFKIMADPKVRLIHHGSYPYGAKEKTS